MDIVDKAREFATKAHEGQKRKYTGVPYIEHPAAVVEIVKSVPHTDEMLAAAWLHDVVEDCGVGLSVLCEEFGGLVAQFVRELTDTSKPSDGNRAARKAIDLRHTSFASPQAKTVKIADLIHNTSSIVQYDPSFTKVYLREKQALLEVLTEGNPTLWRRAKDLVRNEDNHGA